MTEKARDEASDKERRRRQEATLKLKRRASAGTGKMTSQDDKKVDMDELKQRARQIINKKDEVMKRHANAKGDSDTRGKNNNELSSRGSNSRRSSNASDDKNASFTRLKSSTDKKVGMPQRHASFTSKSSADSGGIKNKEGRPQRRTSTESEHKQVQSRRSSHDSDVKPKAKAVMDLKTNTSKRPARRSSAPEKADLKKLPSQKDLKTEVKPRPRLPRSSSVGDIGVGKMDVTKKKTNESNNVNASGKKSKDDMDIHAKNFPGRHKGGKGKNRSKSLLMKKSKSSTDLKLAEKESKDWKELEQKMRGKLSSALSPEQKKISKRLSVDNADLSRPKRRSLDRTQSTSSLVDTKGEKKKGKEKEKASTTKRLSGDSSDLSKPKRRSLDRTQSVSSLMDTKGEKEKGKEKASTTKRLSGDSSELSRPKRGLLARTQSMGMLKNTKGDKEKDRESLLSKRPLHRSASDCDGLKKPETNSDKKTKKRLSLDETKVANSDKKTKKRLSLDETKAARDLETEVFIVPMPGEKKDMKLPSREKAERCSSMRLAPNKTLDTQALKRISSSFNEGVKKREEDKDKNKVQAEPPESKAKTRKMGERSKSMKIAPKKKSISEAKAIRKLRSSFRGAFTDIDDLEDGESRGSKKGKKKMSRKSSTRRKDELEDGDSEPPSKQDKPRKKMGERSKSMKLAPKKKSISEAKAIRKLRSSVRGVFTNIDDLEDGESRGSRKGKKKVPRQSSTRRKKDSLGLMTLNSTEGQQEAEVEHKTELGETTSELDSYLENKSPGHTVKSSTKSSPSSQATGSESGARVKWPRWKQLNWKFVCCTALIFLLMVAVIVFVVLLTAFDKSVEINVGLKGSADDAKTKDVTSDAPTVSAVAASVDLSTRPTKPLTFNPSISPSAPATSLAPTPSPVQTVAIVVIVQLDAKPEETGFHLVSADNSITYISRPIGSLSDQQNEVVMEVVSVTKQTELVFTIEDKSGDGLCCTHGNGYYRVVAGTGDQKVKMVSGEQSANYKFTAGTKQPALKIGGVDRNENCKPCPDGKDCGRCAWCNANEGFLPDTTFSYQCHSELKPIPRKCFIGEKRHQLHNQYVAAMAGCGNGFEAHPQIQSSLEATICVEEAKCVKTFLHMEPECDEELSGSLLVKETCQDKIGGLSFGYSWGHNAPREKECPSSGKFAEMLAQRCCVDGVAFCSALNANDSEEIVTTVSDQETIAPTPMPAAGNTYTPTESNAPTWDGYPISVLIQLDDFPRETGFTITSVDKTVTYFERRQGYYKQKSQLAVEKVQIPEGIEAILTLTDEQGDGICCENGDGYFQIYSDKGSLILDEAGTFATNTSNTFFVGDPKTLPPTVSTSPTVSVAPTFDQFPITIAVQLDQWSAETGFSIQSTDGILTYSDWPAGSFSGQPSSLVVVTVQLPRNTELNLRVTDAGGDGFCCLYGNGYIKIFAGESADDNSQILASEDGDFESDLSIMFRAGPAPPRAPTPTSTPTKPEAYQLSLQFLIASGITASSPTVQMTVVLQLDKYSSETGWSIDSSDGLANFASRSVGYYEENKSEKVIQTIQIPEGLEYQFKIIDFMGDGTCCWAGNGWYSLYEGTDITDLSTQVFYGDGDFGREGVHTFIAGKPKTASPTRSRVPSEMPSDWPSLAPSHSSSPSATKYALEVTIKLDDNSSQTGWYITSEGGVVIIDRPAGWYNGNDTLSVTETVKLEAGEYIFSVLDTNGDGFCCSQGVGFYSLYSNGDLLIFEKGKFEYSHNETFSIYANTNEILSTTKSAQMLRGSNPSSYNPNRQRNHADKKPTLTEKR